MLGRTTYRLEAFPRSWVQHLWGYADISTRQKWAIMWPYLRELPDEPLAVLDAGCGPGAWALELAARRPAWRVVGLDRDAAALTQAEKNRSRLGLTNVTFQCGGFMEHEPRQAYDVILSITSAHYLAAQGMGEELFRRFSGWLKPTGRLLLLGPRRLGEAPFNARLPRQNWHSVFSREELQRLTEESGLKVDHLIGRIGRIGTLAKQLQLVISRGPAWLKVMTYPALHLLTVLDYHLMRGSGRAASMMWILVAQKGTEAAS